MWPFTKKPKMPEKAKADGEKSSNGTHPEEPGHDTRRIEKAKVDRHRALEEARKERLKQLEKLHENTRICKQKLKEKS